MIRTLTSASLSYEELRHADEATRRWYRRVLTLVNDTGCTLELAIAAVQAVDEQTTANRILKQRAAVA